MKPDRRDDLRPKTLKRSTLAIVLIVLLVFSVFLGITAGAIGLGSISAAQLDRAAGRLRWTDDESFAANIRDRDRDVLRSKVVLR